MDASLLVRAAFVCLYLVLVAIGLTPTAYAYSEPTAEAEAQTSSEAADDESVTNDAASADSVQVMAMAAALSAPSSISYPSTNGSGTFDVSWGAVAGAELYNLQEQKNSGSWVGAGSVFQAGVYKKTLSGRTNGTYKYRVRACTIDGTCSTWTTGSTSLTVALVAPTASLSALPSAVASGGQSSLTWTSTNAATCTLDGASVATSGSLIKTAITSTTTYTLVCTNPLSSATSVKSVTVVPPPVISIFSANPNPVARGSTTTLTWTVSNSPTCTVDGTTRTSPFTSSALSADKTFTLVCSNIAGSDSRQLLVTAPPVPVISSFIATPNPLATGASTSLSWAASNAVQCQINGTTRTSPWSTGTLSATTNYSLVCSNVSGSDTEPLTVTVGPPTVLNSYTADANPIASGQGTTLRWNVSNATGNSCSLNNGIGTVSAVGNVATGTLTASKSYRLQCSGLVNNIDQTLTVTVNPAPTISSFTAAQNPIAIGTGTTLAWSTSNTTSCSLFDGSSSQSVATSVSSRATGSLTASTTYRLTCTGTNNATVQRELAVSAVATPVATLSAAFSHVQTGEFTTLSWTSDNADFCTLNGQALPQLDGSIATAALSTTTTYTLQCSSQIGSVQKDVIVTVLPAESLWRSIGACDPRTGMVQQICRDARGCVPETLRTVAGSCRLSADCQQ